ncbi:regulator of Vps4 activity in the MVB pathway protein [Striga asiatica]|uniref:Regulator of Vps4 activity in the MVB pathway protein n=1 Tax=Striga asiatica TaxID=4170 RepID=A0A5A7PMQ8_STRAF|nr:regulator of Vps4 activity in the MVB pathway protein [Striga asiatica]
MKSSPNFILPCLLILLLTPTQSQTIPNPKPDSKLPSKQTPNPASISPNPKLEPDSNSIPPHPKLEPPLSNSTSPKSEPTRGSNTISPHTKPPIDSPTKSAPDSNSTSPNKNNATSPHEKPTTDSHTPDSKPKPAPPKVTPKPKNATSPYKFVNHFCLSRRLDVKATFCLQVLRSSAASTEAEDNQALLAISADAAIKFGRKNIAILKKLSAGRKSDLKAAVGECTDAYDGYIKQFQTLVEEAAVEAQLASYDSELAKMEIGRCVRAAKEAKNGEIEKGNKAALDYASLAQSIADSIG